jgi:hypothetical protein
LPVPIISVTSCIIESVSFLSRLRDVTKAYTRIIRLKKSNFDVLILEKALSLSQVKRSVIRRGVPFPRIS